MIKTIAALAAAASLAACVAPTPYRVAGSEGNNFGYTSSKLSDQVWRVRFSGTRRTPLRWVDAFLLSRAAEVAREANAPGFKIIEGTVDVTVLTGEDLFGWLDPDAEVVAVATSNRPQPQGDMVVGSQERPAFLQRTAGAMPVFRMPPPPLPKYQPPVYIYTPGYVAPVLQDRTILVELRENLKDKDAKTFETDEVLQKLGPRIKRPVPATDVPTTPAKSL